MAVLVSPIGENHQYQFLERGARPLFDGPEGSFYRHFVSPYLTGHKGNDILPVSLRHQGIFFIGSEIVRLGADFVSLLHSPEGVKPSRYLRAH
jgi:hypothetical protein